MQRLGQARRRVRPLRRLDRFLRERDVQVSGLQLGGELGVVLLAGRERVRLPGRLGLQVAAQRMHLKLALRDCLVRQLRACLLGVLGQPRCLVPALAPGGDEPLGGRDLLRQSANIGRRGDG